MVEVPHLIQYRPLLARAPNERDRARLREERALDLGQGVGGGVGGEDAEGGEHVEGGEETEGADDAVVEVDHVGVEGVVGLVAGDVEG